MNKDKKSCENCGCQTKEWCHPKKDEICKDWQRSEDTMNPELDAGLAERLYNAGIKEKIATDWLEASDSMKEFMWCIAAEVRKIVKEAKGGRK